MIEFTFNQTTHVTFSDVDGFLSCKAWAFWKHFLEMFFMT